VYRARDTSEGMGCTQREPQRPRTTEAWSPRL